MYYYKLILAAAATLSISLVNAFPSPLIISEWRSMLDNNITILADNVLQAKRIQEIYSSDNVRMQLSEINGMEMLKQTLSKMREILEKKESALQRLVAAAEEAVGNHIEDSQLTLEQVAFFNMKEVRKNDARLEFSTHFLQNVSFNESGVHIPLEIYEGYPKILNGLKWSAALDKVFKENLKLDPTLRWQYFGSQRGFMRVYPAFRWPEIPNLPDLFDVRRRSWYIQGSVSSKNMIILIDTSGSVHGQTFDIMKIAIKALLYTLGENDYVNVAWFNQDAAWVLPCLNTLVQATSHHKRLLFDAIDELREGNLTSYSRALEFAYDAFKKFEEEKQAWEGSNCHKVIMLFSDGGTEWPAQVLQHYKNHSLTENVKVFTYACGPHPIPTVILKRLACETQGYFNTITALGAIRTRIQDYVRVLSRPLILSGNENFYQWSNFYRDIGGLGMMTTVTLPVANDSSSTALVGVMGVDVPLSEMESLFPKKIIGPVGYGFAINPNGFVVFHPRLHEQITYIEEPPDLDLLELEGRTEIILKIRNAMVSGDTGSMQDVLSPVIVDSQHILPVLMNYYYGPIGNSSFRFALAIPKGHVMFEINGLSHEAGLKFESPKGVLIAPWVYCRDLEEDASVMTLSEAIANNTYNCDNQLIQSLLWDSNKIASIWKHWEKTNTNENTFNRFLFTASGLTAVYPEKEVVHYLSQRDPNNNGFFKRTSLSKDYILSVRHPKRNGVREPSIAFGKKLTIEQKGMKYIPAVVGAETNKNLIQDIFKNVTYNGENINCANTDTLYCFLIDDASVIFASNQPDAKVGSLLSTFDTQLMSGLVENSVFTVEERFNFQAWCPYHHMSDNLPASATSKFANAIFATIFNIFQMFHYFISSLIIWTLPAASTDALNIFGWQADIINDNHTCVSKLSWLHYNGKDQYQGTIHCIKDDETNCTRNITLSLLPKASLILLVTDIPCDCTYIIKTEKPPPYVSKDSCVMKQPYRIRPTTCHTFSDKENATECGNSANCINLNLKLVLVLFVLTIFNTI